MSTCDPIAGATYTVGCPAPGGGILPEIYAIPLSEWKLATITTVGKKISNIVLTTVGARAFKFNLHAGAGSASSSNTGMNEAGHPIITSTVVAYMDQRDSVTLSAIDYFDNNLFVLLVPAKSNEGGLSVLGGYVAVDGEGQGVGLKCSSSWDTAANGGATMLTFAPIAGQEESIHNYILKGANNAATAAVLAALIVPIPTP